MPWPPLRADSECPGIEFWVQVERFASANRSHHCNESSWKLKALNSWARAWIWQTIPGNQGGGPSAENAPVRAAPTEYAIELERKIRIKPQTRAHSYY